LRRFGRFGVSKGIALAYGDALQCERILDVFGESCGTAVRRTIRRQAVLFIAVAWSVLA
jgi:hypothetical protein